MLKVGFAIVFFFIVGKSYSQQPGYLVLIDADNEQIFRVRIGDTVYNSSDLGHLTIPYLKDSTYNLMVGFPRKVFREHTFSIKMNKKDLGFQLRNLGEKGWVLYNWQTRETIMPLIDTGNAQLFPEQGIKRDDAFSRLMAAVVNDTSVMYNAFVSQKITDTSTLRKSDTTLVAGVNEQATTAGIAPASQVKSAAKSKYPFVKKLSERSTAKTKRITYIDATSQESRDTITLFIPIETDALIVSSDSTNKVIPTRNKKKGKPSTAQTDSANTVARFNCQVTATDKDVDSLKSNILSANTIDAKMGEAEKYFKAKCFLSEQIKSLSELFASDKSKFTFFHLAHPYISDRTNISQLAMIFKDTSYISRFKKETASDN